MTLLTNLVNSLKQFQVKVQIFVIYSNWDFKTITLYDLTDLKMTLDQFKQFMGP